LRPLGVTSARRSAVYPELPAIAEVGLAGYDIVTPFSLFAPAGTPPAIQSRLNADIGSALRQNDVKERFLAAGGEVVAGSPADLAAMMKADVARMSKVIKAANVKGE
jgi:tripartite-type tricarboxylate transporter receptor subunit TctC